MPEATVTAFECKCATQVSHTCFTAETGTLQPPQQHCVLATRRMTKSITHLKVHSTVNLLGDLYCVSHW